MRNGRMQWVGVVAKRKIRKEIIRINNEEDFGEH